MGGVGLCRRTERFPQSSHLSRNLDVGVLTHHHGGDRAVGQQRDLAGYGFDQGERERVDVSCTTDHGARSLLGGGIAGGTDESTFGFGPRRFSYRPGDPEIGDAQATIGTEQKVGRFDIAVNEPPLVGDLETFESVKAHHHRLTHREAVAVIEHVAKAPAGEQFGHEVTVITFGPVVKVQNPGMGQLSHRLGLVVEPLGESGVLDEGLMEHLHRHPTLE